MLFHMDTNIREIKEILKALQSIDVSLQLLASSTGEHRRTTAFVSKKVITQRLNIPSVAIDKLIHQGIASRGASGLVEGKHYCKLDPSDNNSAKFLYDAQAIIDSAWESFKNV